MELYKDYQIDVEELKRVCSESWKLKEYENGYMQPPLHFKGFSDIDVSHNFNLGGLKHKDIELLCQAPNRNFHLGNLLIDLAKLNLELRKLRMEKIHDLYDIMMGIASGFNFDDIEFYIGRWKEPYDRSSRDEAKMYMLLNIYKSSFNWTHAIQWVLSNKTIKRIENELIKKLENGVKYT